jgi:hypothetical protein
MAESTSMPSASSITSSQVQPRADQPRVMTSDLARGEAPASVQYRTTGIKSYSRSGTRRDYSSR